MKKLENLPVTRNVIKIMQEDDLDKRTIAQGIGVSERGFDDMLSGNQIITAFNITQLCMVLGVDANALLKINPLSLRQLLAMLTESPKKGAIFGS